MILKSQENEPKKMSARPVYTIKPVYRNPDTKYINIQTYKWGWIQSKSSLFRFMLFGRTSNNVD